MKSFASARLLETLNWWKALNYRREVLTSLAQSYLIADPGLRQHFTRWRGYEQMVLNNAIKELNPIEWMVFPKQREHHLPLTMLDQFPCELFEWNRKSRRTFHLPDGLQLFLSQGRYDNMRWQDILWPYDSFVLTLDRPIEIEDTEDVWSHIDTILVSHVPVPGRGKTLRMRYLRKPAGTMLGVFPERRRNLISGHLAARDVERAIRAVNATTARIIEDAGGAAQGYRSFDLYTTVKEITNIPQHGDLIRIEPEQLVEDYERVTGRAATEEQRFQMGNLAVAARLVVGWALWMGTNSTNAYRSIRQPPSPRMRGTAGIITSPEHICTMLAVGRIDPARYVETPATEVSSSTFKRPHWRRGHMKHAPGADPKSPKTIRVPPMLIRKDLIPFFGVISGTATWIVDDEDDE